MPDPRIQVGMTGRLEFQASMVGVDPTLVETITFQPTGTPNNVTFTAPDQVEGKVPGKDGFKCIVHTTDGDKMSWKFDLICEPAGPPAPPVVVPITVFVTSGLTPAPAPGATHAP